MTRLLRLLKPAAPERPRGPMPLAALEANEDAFVVELPECPLTCQRLASLGIAPGLGVRMLCKGRTCLLCAGRARLSLRLEDTRGILVERAG